jgi:hypothetical protein
MHRRRLGFVLGLATLLVPTLAAANPRFKGSYELAGRYSTTRQTKATLVVDRVGNTWTVARTGRYSAAAHSDVPNFTWTSDEVRIRGRVMHVTYRLGEDRLGILSRVDPDTASRDDLRSLLDQRGYVLNTFEAVYMLSADRASITEYVTNRTRNGAETFWSWVWATGNRRPASATASAFLRIATPQIRAWHGDYIRETWRDILSWSSPAEAVLRRQLRDSDLNTALDDIAVDDTELQWLRERDSVHVNADGYPVPAGSITVLYLHFYTESAGMVLSQTFAFDLRTGELLALVTLHA